MAWRIEYERAAARAIDKLDPAVRTRILKTLDRIVILGQAPRTSGHALVGEWTDHWRYRVGDWRVIARIEDARVIVVLVAIGHRSGIYG